MPKFTFPEWYKNPEMLGHKYAKENLDLALEIQKKYVKTKAQKALFNATVDLNDQEWHRWVNGMTKSYLGQIRFALRRIDKVTAYNLYYQIDLRHGMLKSDLLRYLELRAYTLEKEEFLKDYCKRFGFYGMGKDEAIERCNRYMIDLVKRYKYQVA